MKNVIRILGFFAFTFILTSCFDDPGTEILLDTSNATVELSAATGAQSVFTYLRVNDGSTAASGFEVATSSANAVNVSFEIDGSSTAVAGVHYTVSGTSVAIAAGEYKATLPITILPDNIEAGEQWTIVINITSADVDISEVYKTATHTVQISCPPNIPLGTYTTAALGAGDDPDGCATGDAYAGASVEVTYNESTGIYTISDADIGYFSGDYVAGTTFDNICDNLTLYGDATAPYGISFVGTGIFIPGGGANGNGRIVFQCYYDQTYAGSGATETVAYDAP